MCSNTQEDDTGVSKNLVATFAIGEQRILFIQIHLKAFPTDRASCAQREGQAEVVRQQVMMG